MAKRLIHKIAVFSAIAALATACVYPYETEVMQVASLLVVDGGIYVGEESTFTLSYLSSLSVLDDENALVPRSAELWVESDGGKKYPGVLQEGTTNVFTVNLTDAPDNEGYRLRITNNDTGKHYSTDWKQVRKPAVIDDLSYNADPESDHLSVAMSMHGVEGSHYRWTYSETWEYHAKLRAWYYYIPATGLQKTGTVVPFEGNENLYYCWDNEESSEILLFDTSSQTDNRFKDLEFHTVDRSSNKLQIMYYVKVALESLDEEGYVYWKTMKENNYNQNTIFSPTPSEVRGNIVCEEDPSELVMGYVNVARRASRDLFFNNILQGYYINPKPHLPDAVYHPEEEWEGLYRKGFVPIGWFFELETLTSGYTWAEQQCADCRWDGGTKNKPAFWPNDDI